MSFNWLVIRLSGGAPRPERYGNQIAALGLKNA
jgi:hypothetical protein